MAKKHNLTLLFYHYEAFTKKKKKKKTFTIILTFLQKKCQIQFLWLIFAE